MADENDRIAVAGEELLRALAELRSDGRQVFGVRFGPGDVCVILAVNVPTDR